MSANSFFSDLDDMPEKNQNKASSFFSDLPEEPSRLRSILSALPKGLIKGASSSNLLPSFGPVSAKKGAQLTEEFLPTRQGETLEDVLEFTGEMAPAAAVGTGGLVAKGGKALLGGLAKKGAKELNLPEWAQDIVGVTAQSVPGGLKSLASKTLRPSGKETAVVDYLKSKGLSDRQITPILKNKKTVSILSKGAFKYEDKSPFIKGIKEKLGGIYDDIRESGTKSGYIKGPDLTKFETDFYKTFDKIPRMYKKAAQPAIDELFKNPIDFTSLHDFNKEMNSIIGSMDGGKAILGKLKAPVEKAQKNLSPELFNELGKVNKFYSKINSFADKMTKKNWEGFLKLGEAGGLLTGLLTLNPILMKGAALYGGSRLALREILTNPRLHNMHLKLWDLVLKNKFPQALKLSEIMKKSLEKNQED